MQVIKIPLDVAIQNGLSPTTIQFECNQESRDGFKNLKKILKRVKDNILDIEICLPFYKESEEMVTVILGKMTITKKKDELIYEIYANDSELSVGVLTEQLFGNLISWTTFLRTGYLENTFKKIEVSNELYNELYDNFPKRVEDIPEELKMIELKKYTSDDIGNRIKIAADIGNGILVSFDVIIYKIKDKKNQIEVFCPTDATIIKFDKNEFIHAVLLNKHLMVNDLVKASSDSDEALKSIIKKLGFNLTKDSKLSPDATQADKIPSLKKIESEVISEVVRVIDKNPTFKISKKGKIKYIWEPNTNLLASVFSIAKTSSDVVGASVFIAEKSKDNKTFNCVKLSKLSFENNAVSGIKNNNESFVMTNNDFVMSLVRYIEMEFLSKVKDIRFIEYSLV